MKNEESHSSNPVPPRDIVERTFDFGVQVTILCMKLDREGGVGRVLYPQILRSGTSVGSNVEEAQAGQSKADFISKMSIALKEARETHYRLRILSHAEVLPASKISQVIKEADEIRRVIGAIIVSCKNGTEK